MSYTGVTTIKGKKYIWLQSVGYVSAKKIESFKKGDKIVYNFGETYKLVSSPKKISPKFYMIKIKSPEGKIYEQRVKAESYKPYYKNRMK